MCIPKVNVLQSLISCYLQFHALSVLTHFEHQSHFKYSVIPFFWYMFMLAIHNLDSSFEEYKPTVLGMVMFLDRKLD